ncbi:transposase [Planctomicrobium sp. SH527]|uniref:transposase n=1 Tax=Planctomicrobium sp. SH527 TaxID=3448123 RepID=UPI003F5AF215
MSQSRRIFTPEFKCEALQLMQREGLSQAEVARRLDIDPSTIRKWQRQLQVQGEQAFPGQGRQTSLEEENRRLREENARLKMEREILKKATAFFAKESK